MAKSIVLFWQFRSKLAYSICKYHNFKVRGDLQDIVYAEEKSSLKWEKNVSGSSCISNIIRSHENGGKKQKYKTVN